MTKWQRLRYKTIGFLWPPYAVAFNNAYVRDSKPSWETIRSQVSAQVSVGREWKVLTRTSKELAEDAETRRQTLEEKAGTFVSGTGVGLAVFALIPALTAEPKFNDTWGAFVTAVYLIGLLFLVMAVHHALLVRKVGEYHRITTEDLTEALTSDDPERELAERLLANLGWNESFLVEKTNYLVGAEMMFSRGLTLVMFGVVTRLAAQAFL